MKLRLLGSILMSFLLAVVLLGCDGPAPTGLRLTVSYDEAWELERLELRARERTTSMDVRPELLLLVPDDWTDGPLTGEVWGLRGDVRLAHGEVTVTLVEGATVDADVTLERTPCGDWCTPGEITCVGDGTALCAERAEDGCAAWGQPTACPDDTPHCSLGRCAIACTDECLAGEVRCDGARAVRRCGESDSDACADWMPSVACDGDTVCSNGECAATCRDECTTGVTTCLGDALTTCGDLDGDGCTEWAPPMACTDGWSCSSGACVEVCSDECSVSTCAGLTHTSCGQFDSDPCRDRSSEVTCESTDGCLVGSCSPEGCATVPLACDTPPSICWAAPGTCSEGECSYAPVDGVNCDDADACTVGDLCGSGRCAGTPMACDTPPAPFCEGHKKLHTFATTGTCSAGACAYVESVTECAECSNGACTGKP